MLPTRVWEGEEFDELGSHVLRARARTRVTPPIGSSSHFSVPFINGSGATGEGRYIPHHGRGIHGGIPTHPNNTTRPPSPQRNSPFPLPPSTTAGLPNPRTRSPNPLPISRATHVPSTIFHFRFSQFLPFSPDRERQKRKNQRLRRRNIRGPQTETLSSPPSHIHSITRVTGKTGLRAQPGCRVTPVTLLFCRTQNRNGYFGFLGTKRDQKAGISHSRPRLRAP